tara:strand:+ start:680 stop:1123 length:444 start_codon:yes stop_codon:yes gene_type:complete
MGSDIDEMKELAVVFGVYLVVGLVVCVVLAFRKGKSPHSVKAIEFFDMGGGPIGLGLGMLLWPFWVLIQIVDQNNLELPKEREATVKEDLRLLIGCRGVAVTPMVPSGRIRLRDRYYEAISEGPKLEEGDEVEVLAISMGILRVRET